MKAFQAIRHLLPCASLALFGIIWFETTFSAFSGMVIPWGDTSVPGGLTNINQVSSGSWHTVALRGDGTVVAWGVNAIPDLLSVPSGMSNVIAISAGNTHTLALKSDGKVVAWGAGQTNAGSYPNFGQSLVPTNLDGVTAVVAGPTYSLALKSDRTVVFWGVCPFSSVISGLSNIVAISVGQEHGLALKTDGSVVVWGSNLYGQTNIPPNLTNVISIAAGGYHNLAITGDHKVVAWGGTNSGYWPEQGQSLVPADLNDVVAVAAGSLHSLALKSDGTVKAWGSSFPYGQGVTPYGLCNVLAIACGRSSSFAVNDGTPALIWVPASVSAYSGGFVSFTVGAIGPGPFSCRWRFNGTNVLSTNGPNFSVNDVQFGDSGSYSVEVQNPYGSVVSPPAILTVNDAAPIILQQPQSLTVASRDNPEFHLWYDGSKPLSIQWSCNGTNIPWGTDSYLSITNAQGFDSGNYVAVLSNAFGIVTSQVAQLTVVPTPVFVWAGPLSVPPGASNSIAIAAGGNHCLALRTDGTVVAWGDDSRGQCRVPEGLSNVASIAAGAEHSLALREDGTVIAWGGENSVVTNVPAGLTNILAVSAGYNFSLALKNDGTVACWGNVPDVATMPAGLTNVIAVDAGDRYALALRDDGTVVGWGWSLGGGEVVPSGLSNVVAISAGYSHSLALRSDGTVVAWGVSYQGMGGSVTPPAGLSNVVAIAAGGGYFGDHSLALKSDGELVAWGSNENGQTNIPMALSNASAISAGGYFSLALETWNSSELEMQVFEPVWDNNSFSMSVPSRSGRVYAVEFKNSFGEGQWMQLPLVAGNGAKRVLRDSTATAAQRFYRVRRW